MSKRRLVFPRGLCRTCSVTFLVNKWESGRSLFVHNHTIATCVRERIHGGKRHDEGNAAVESTNFLELWYIPTYQNPALYTAECISCDLMSLAMPVTRVSLGFYLGVI